MDATNLLLVTSIGYAILIAYSLSRPFRPSIGVFVLVLLVSLVWDITYYYELTLPLIDEKIFARKTRILFLSWLPVLWLVMLRTLLGIGMRLPSWFLGLSVGVSILAGVASETQQFHNLFLYDFSIVPVGKHGILTFRKGFVFLFYEQYSLVVCLVTIALMLRSWPTALPLMRRYLALLLVGYIVPFIANMLWQIGFTPIPGLHLAPFMTIFSISALFVSVIRYRVLDTLPIARTAVLEQLNDLVFVFDSHGHILDMNKHSKLSTGCSPVAYGTLTLEALPEPWRSVLRGPGAVYEIPTPAGRKWFDSVFTELRDKRGEGLGRLCVMHDITRQHEMQQALTDREQQLKGILDSLAQAVFIHDDKGKIEYFNSPATAIYDLDHPERMFTLNALTDLSAPENGEGAAQAAICKALSGEKVAIADWIARKPLSGETFRAKAVLHRISKGNEQKVLATITDTTEDAKRHASQLEYQKLLEQKRYLRQMELLVRDLHDGIGGLVAGIGMVARLGLEYPDCDRRLVALRKIAALAGEADGEIRGLMNTLESHELLWPDLVVDMRHHAALMQENYGLNIRFAYESAGVSEGPGLYAGMSLFRVFKEALNNVVKHAEATAVTVPLRLTDGLFFLGICDNGSGFPATLTPGRGLRNMRQRIEELGGVMRLCPAAVGVHLEFEVRLPLQTPDDSSGAEEARRFLQR